jgi:hypothetical protein
MIDILFAGISSFVAIASIIAVNKFNDTSALAEKIAVSIVGGGALMNLVGLLSSQLTTVPADLMLLSGIAIYMTFKYLARGEKPEKATK